MSDDYPKSTNGVPVPGDKVEADSLKPPRNLDTATNDLASTGTVLGTKAPALSNGNSTANGDHSKSDSEAETVVLDGKEEGATKKVIKHEDASDVEGNLSSAATKRVDHQEIPLERAPNGARKPSLKRKRIVQESSLHELPEAGNSSNLSSTYSSPPPQLHSDGDNGSASDRAAVVAKEARKKKSRLRKRKLETAGGETVRQQRGKSDPSSVPVNGQERQGKRRVKEYDASSTRSESPPTHQQHPRLHFTETSIHSGVKRRKAPPSTDRRRKASEDIHPESDDSTFVHSRPHLHKSASIDEHAMGKSHKKMLDRSGRTPVARACANDNIQQLKIELEERPYHLNEPDYAQNTPLQIAALGGFANIVRYLIDQGCIVNCKNIDGDTPLVDAIENGHLEVVTQLLQAGADPRLRNGKGDEPLDLVNSDNDEDGSIRNALLNTKVDDLQRRPSEDQATGNRDNDGASVSASAGSPTDSTQGKGPPTGSETSRQSQGRASLGSEAARRKTARSQPTRDGLLWINATPERLREAASKGDIEVVGHILNSRPADTESMLVAARGGHEVVLQLLIALGRNPEPDPDPLRSSEYKPGHNTPMLAAIGGGNVKVLELLLKQPGFNPTRRLYRDYTYYELAKQRQSFIWQQEYNLLKEAYDSYSADPGRRSIHSSPRKIRTKSAVGPSPPPLAKRHERPSDGLERRSSHRSLSQKQVRSDDERKDAAAVASDREAGTLEPSNAKIRGGARSASDAGSMAPSRLEPNAKPRRRLLSKNEMSDQDLKRRASSALERSPSSTYDKPRRQSSDTPAAGASDGKDAIQSSSPIKHEGAKKRPRVNSSPRSSTSDPGKPQDVTKKKQRVDSRGNAFEHHQGEPPPRGPAMVANMIASPEPIASPISAPGTAPVAFMGGNSSSSPKVRSPDDTKSSMKSLLGSIDRTRHQDSLAKSSQSQKQQEQSPRRSASIQGTPPMNENSNHGRHYSTSHDQNIRPHDIELQDKEAQARQEERERHDQLKREREVEAFRKREADAAREREAEASRQRQAEEARLQEEAHLKAQHEAEELERQLQHEREEEEAREAKKRNEEMLARRAEQERQQREKEERRRADLEHREQMRRLRLQEEQEQQRREALPNGLRIAAELSPEEAREPEWINKWLPLYTVETEDLDPECDREDAHERWVANIQVAPILACRDLELSQFTAWPHRPITPHERTSLWRLLRNQQSGTRIPSLRCAKDEKTLFNETRPKFFALEPAFWVRYSDFMDIVPRHPHLRGELLYTRAMALRDFPVEGGEVRRNGEARNGEVRNADVGNGEARNAEEGQGEVGVGFGKEVLVNGLGKAEMVNGHL